MYLLYIIYWLLSRENLKNFKVLMMRFELTCSKNNRFWVCSVYHFATSACFLKLYHVYKQLSTLFFKNCRRNDYHQFVATPQTLLCVEHIYNIAHIFPFVNRFFIFLYFCMLYTIFFSFFFLFLCQLSIYFLHKTCYNIIIKWREITSSEC